MAKTVILHTIDYDGMDGTRCVHFRDLVDAQRFAQGKLLWGEPVQVQTNEVPRHIADRWVR
jgi:hypothetical protein